jgi:hypothetical protein
MAIILIAKCARLMRYPKENHLPTGRKKANRTDVKTAPQMIREQSIGGGIPLILVNFAACDY